MSIKIFSDIPESYKLTFNYCAFKAEKQTFVLHRSSQNKGESFYENVSSFTFVAALSGI